MSEHTGLTREEYELTKVALAREDVPAGALSLLSTWIEGEGLLVDDREDVGGLAAGADTKGLIRRSVCPGTRSQKQGGRRDQQAARQRSGR